MSGPPARSERRWALAVLAAAILGIAAVFYALQPDRVDVSVATATYQDIESSVSTNGIVVPLEKFQARANFPGVVEKVYVQLGQKVQPGQMLVKMKDPYAASRVATANAALQATQSTREDIQQNGSKEERVLLGNDRTHAQLEQSAAANGLAELKRLQQNGSASAAEVGGAAQRLAAANATLDALNARTSDRYSAADRASWDAKVAQARAQLGAEKASFQNANIASPIAGTVYLVPISQYDFVPMGADLLEIADLSKIQVHANFDEPDIGKLHDGQAVNVSWAGKPDRIWHGHLNAAPMAVITSGTRSIGESTITIDDANGDLPANTNVTVTVTLQDRRHVLTIPREALHTEAATSYVFSVVEGKLTRTPVTVGVLNLSRVEITQGLAAGDQVALHAADNRPLISGLKVRVVR